MNGNSACSWEGVSDRPAENRFDPIYRTCLELFLRTFANDHDRSEGKR